MAEVLLEQRVFFDVEFPCLENWEEFRCSGLVARLHRLLLQRHQYFPFEAFLVDFMGVGVQILLDLSCLNFLPDELFPCGESQRNILFLLHLPKRFHHTFQFLLLILLFDCGVVPGDENFVHVLGGPNTSQLRSDGIELAYILPFVHIFNKNLKALLDQYFISELSPVLQQPPLFDFDR